MGLFGRIAAGKGKPKTKMTATQTRARQLAQQTGGRAARLVGKPGGNMVGRIKEAIGQTGNVSMAGYAGRSEKRPTPKGATPQFIVPESDEELMNPRRSRR